MKFDESGPAKNIPLAGSEVYIEEKLREYEALLAQLRQLKVTIADVNSINDTKIAEIEDKNKQKPDDELASILNILLELKKGYEKSIAEIDVIIVNRERMIAEFKQNLENRRARLLDKFEGPAQ